MEFSKQEYWSGLPFLLQGIFPTQDQTQVSHIAGTLLPTERPGKPLRNLYASHFIQLSGEALNKNAFKETWNLRIWGW